MTQLQKISKTPLWGLSNLQRDLDTVFEDFFPQLRRTTDFGFNPSCDVTENETSYIFRMDLPGVEKNNIHVEMKNNQLQIWGEKNEEKTTTEGKRHITERFSGKFSRSFSLQGVNGDNIVAKHQNGVLEVIVPKTEEAKPKKILVS